MENYKAKAVQYLQGKIDENNGWTIDYDSRDLYEPTGYQGEIMGKYVFITTYRITIALVDVYDSTTGELVLQYDTDEFDMQTAYARLEGIPLIDALDIESYIVASTEDVLTDLEYPCFTYLDRLISDIPGLTPEEEALFETLFNEPEIEPKTFKFDDEITDDTLPLLFT